MNNSNGEFKGTTKEAIKDIRGDITEIKDDIKYTRRWLTAVTVITSIALIERAPGFLKNVISIAMAATGN